MNTHDHDLASRDVHALLHAALAGAEPGTALQAHWPDQLRTRPCRLLAAGKAAPTMLRAVVDRKLCTIARALCIGVPGSAAVAASLGIPVEANDADHPLPTRRNVDAAERVRAFVSEPRADEPLVVLLSGGASALLTLPRPPLTLDDCRAVTDALLRAGAPIEPLNRIRKHLEVLKGGGLARLAAPAGSPVHVLVLSDVIGDDLATIASGPACADPSTFIDALHALERYRSLDASTAATRYLREGAAGHHAETVKPGDPVLAHVHHAIIANNHSALDATAARAARLGYEVVGIEYGVTGEAREVGRRFAALARRVRSECPRPSAILLGGETTVTVTGRGTGGRNQELALAAAIELDAADGIVLAAFSTDGVDGATDAAGAFTTPTTLPTAAAAGANARDCLHDNDSSRFFHAAGGLLRTGPTGTNVNDVAVALITPAGRRATPLAAHPPTSGPGSGYLARTPVHNAPPATPVYSSDRPSRPRAKGNNMITGGLTIHRLLAGMKKHGASDLHIKVGIPPIYRINGLLKAIGAEPLTEDEADHLLDPIIPEKKRSLFEDRGDLDFAAHNEEGDRFRVNMFRSGGHVNAAIRRVKAEIPSYADLHLPPIFGEIISRTNEGLVLVVGVTGSGKSSTLAAMIEQINQTEACNIITVEDPVEYRFKPKKSIISQREIGIDVTDYKTALRYIVRQDPDVIFIGEMRDHDTVLAAIQAAETGHLVFATLHTADTMQSFNRMLEFFPREEHAFIRSSLANTLRAILAQRLLPAVEGFEVGVVPATEVLLNSPIVKDKIRNAEEEDIPAIINGSIAEGMMSFTKSLGDLVKKDWVDLRTAMAYAPNRDALDSELKGLEVKAGTLVNRLRGHAKG